MQIFRTGEVTVYQGPKNVMDLVKIFTDLISLAIPVVAGLALLVFFFGLTKFILKAGDEKEVESGKNLMIWGTIALFVLVSIWGILRLLSSEFGLGNTLVVPLLPQ